MKVKGYVFAVMVIIISIAFSGFVRLEKSESFGNIEAITDETDYFTLPEGEYEISIDYSSTEDNRAEIYLPEMNLLELPSTAGEEQRASYKFTLKYDIDKGMIRFVNPQSDNFRLENISITASDFINRDRILFYYIAAIMLALSGCIFIKFVFEKTLAKEQLLAGLVLFFVFVISSAPWIFNPDILRGSDVRDHLQRIEGVMYGLKAGQFPVILYPNFCNNFGELGILYPNTFLLIPAALRIAGISMGVSYRAFICLICLLENLFAYIAARIILKSRKASLIAATVYALTPYLLYNMYQKGTAAGKSMAAAFIPLLFAGIYSIIREKRKSKKWYLIAIGLTGILQSHVVSTFFTACFLALVSACLFRELFLNRENLIALLKAAVLTIGLNFGFIITFAYYYFSDWDRSRLEWRDFFAGLLSLGKLLKDGISYFPAAIALICILLLIMKAISFSDNEEKKLFIAFGICGIVFFWLSTPLFPWKLLCGIPAINTLTNLIQAPHRFILYCAFPTALWAGKALEFKKDGKIILRTAMSVMVFLLTIYGIFVQFNEYFEKDVLLHGIFGNIYTRVAMDYLPVGTSEEDFHSDTGRVSDENAINSIYYSKENGWCTYLYSCSEDGEYAEFPFLYYKGYKAYDQDGREVEVYKGDNNHLRVYLEKGENKSIIVGFKTAPVFTGGYILSLFVMIAGIVSAIVKSRNPTGG